MAPFDVTGGSRSHPMKSSGRKRALPGAFMRGARTNSPGQSLRTTGSRTDPRQSFDVLEEAIGRSPRFFSGPDPSMDLLRVSEVCFFPTHRRRLHGPLIGQRSVMGPERRGLA